MMDMLNELGKFFTEYGVVGCLVVTIVGLVFQERQRRKEREENRTTYAKQQKDLMRVAMAAVSAMKSFAAELRDMQQDMGSVKAKKSLSDYIPAEADLDHLISDDDEE